MLLSLDTIAYEDVPRGNQPKSALRGDRCESGYKYVTHINKKQLGYYVENTSWLLCSEYFIILALYTDLLRLFFFRASCNELSIKQSCSDANPDSFLLAAVQLMRRLRRNSCLAVLYNLISVEASLLLIEPVLR